MTTQPVTTYAPSASRLLAAELRAEMGRLDVSKTELARRLHVSDVWVHRRLSSKSTVQITLEEAVSMAKALDVSVEGLLSPLLPRLDSNQQPSGYLSLLVSDAQVVDLAAFRAGRAA